MRIGTSRAVGLQIVAVVLALSPVGMAQSANPAESGSAAVPPPAGSAASSSADAAKSHDDSYVIGVDDVLTISVWNEAALSKSIPVRSDGRISLPLAGEVQAAGKSPLQLEGEIAEKLKNYITAPQVTVIVQEIKSQNFNILGMVGKPGSYSLTVAPTIMDAIAAAGGFKDFAKQTKVYVLRQGPGGGQARIDFNYKDYIKGKNLDKNKNFKLEPHDTVMVP